MGGRVAKFSLFGSYNVSREEMCRENRLAIRYFALAGIPVAVANAGAQSIVQGVPVLGTKNLLLFGYFLLLLLADRFVIPKRFRHSTTLLYLLQAPVMVISILLGTVWDPTHQAITFPMFMSVIPIFILDYPIRVAGISLGWSIIFCIVATFTKDPAILHPDYIHVAEFYFVSLAVMIIVLKLRLDVVHNLDRANYHLEHDVLTNTRNRLSLETHADIYVGKPCFVAIGDIIHLSLINDFYGNEAGDEVVWAFSEATKSLFGTDHTYRYSGDSLLCVATDISPEEGISRLDACIERLGSAKFSKVDVPASCAFGYVTGTPTSSAELSSMIQLATIYAHQMAHKGEDAHMGGPFDDEALREGIIQSNTGMHAQSYEINQLTGLPTMHYFVVHSTEMLRHVVDLARKPVIGYLNIASFRAYNEKYGYAHGDELLRAFARMTCKILPNRQIAYITGSRLAVLCYLDEVAPAMAKLSDELAAYNPEENNTLRAGFAEYHEGDSIISVMDLARVARKNVRPQDGVSYRIYDEKLDEELRLQKYLVSHVDKALEDGWLQVFYQPIMWSSSQRLANLEALSRWVDPIYGMLSPAQFISILEREQLIYKLSLHVIRNALADIKHMQQMGLPTIPVSVNLSRNDFFACDMVEEVSKLVEESGLSPNVLSIEITESAFAESQEKLKHEVDRFRQRGFPVWMDDFGSEYSTLNLLEDLNFDLVKLDMRFMRNFSEDGRNAIIVSSIIEMCARLGLATLVEGVEEESHVRMLSEMGSDKLQGFYYSRPLPLLELVSLAKKNGWV